MLRRKSWWLAPVVLAGPAVLTSQATTVNDGTAHGDPPYLLEPDWTPLINPKNLDGWQYEHPEKGKWTNSRGIFWDSLNQPKQLLALPGPGDRPLRPLAAR